MHEMTGGDRAWTDYQKLMELEGAIARKVWPTLLQPLQSRHEMAAQMTITAEREAWKSFVEEPLGKVIEQYAEHDALRGLLMTDGKIGVFSHPHDQLCFRIGASFITSSEMVTASGGCRLGECARWWNRSLPAVETQV